MYFNDVPSALEKKEEIHSHLKKKRPVIFLDYDGTLTPIVNNPEDALLSDGMRDILKKLAAKCAMAIVSGRDREDVKNMVGLEQLYYAGSHGFDISGPDGMSMENKGGRECLPSLDESEKELRKRLVGIAGARVERKRFAIAVHFRNANEKDIPKIKETVQVVLADHPDLRKGTGKKILELKPDINWDKGKAILWLMEALHLDKQDVLPIYIGDDITDEDAFRALAHRGIGILVGDHGRETYAHYRLQNTQQTGEFLMWMIQVLEFLP